MGLTWKKEVGGGGTILGKGDVGTVPRKGQKNVSLHYTRGGRVGGVTELQIGGGGGGGVFGVVVCFLQTSQDHRARRKKGGEKAQS